MINTYLTIFYTDVVGLTAAGISLIMLVARVWDAINDPLMGIIADRTRTRWGKFRPYLMFAPPFLAVFNLLTFTVFPVQGVAKVLLCLVCYIGAGMAYTALCVTYGGLVNLIARDSQVRMNYTTARAIGSGIIHMVLSAVAMPMILYFSRSDVANARGYFFTALVCSLALLPCFWLCAWKCKETVHLEVHHEVGEKKPVFESLLNP
jgi:GPH family glycoside/pentoside/hexuronide:cation symporter/probable glucitol transport protein GutA